MCEEGNNFEECFNLDHTVKELIYFGNNVSQSTVPIVCCLYFITVTRLQLKYLLKYSKIGHKIQLILPFPKLYLSHKSHKKSMILTLSYSANRQTNKGENETSLAAVRRLCSDPRKQDTLRDCCCFYLNSLKIKSRVPCRLKNGCF